MALSEAAFEVKRDSTISDATLLTYVKNDAKLNGFDVDADPSISVTVYHAPISGRRLRLENHSYGV